MGLVPPPRSGASVEIQISVDPNRVIENLSVDVADRARENAILRAQVAKLQQELADSQSPRQEGSAT